jgi:flagellar basal-body rod protein FlgB
MEVSFEDQLRSALAKSPGTELKLRLTNPRHIQINNGVDSIDKVKPQLSELKDYELRNDKNNVDIDREMANLSKNELYYNSVTTMLNDEFKQFSLVVSDGRR